MYDSGFEPLFKVELSSTKLAIWGVELGRECGGSQVPGTAALSTQAKLTWEPLEDFACLELLFWKLFLCCFLGLSLFRRILFGFWF